MRGSGIYVVSGPLAFGLAVGMYISGFLCQFHLRFVANANGVFSGIWALSVGYPISSGIWALD